MASFWALFDEDRDDLQEDLRLRNLVPEQMARVYGAISRPRGGAPRMFYPDELSKATGIAPSRLVKYIEVLIHYDDINRDRQSRVFYAVPSRVVRSLQSKGISLSQWVAAWSAVSKFIGQVESYYLYRDYEFRQRGQTLSINKLKARYIKVLNKRGVPKAAYVIKLALKLAVRPRGSSGQAPP
jgi:hypothetical protein